MTLPQLLPDWAPWWAQLVLLVTGLLFALCFLLMPFSVFGVKTRLETIEARLDEIQGEIRSLALRLPEPMGSTYDTDYVLPLPRDDEDLRPARPPIPPQARDAPARWTPQQDAARRGPDGRGPESRPGRNEPRLF